MLAFKAPPELVAALTTFSGIPRGGVARGGIAKDAHRRMAAALQRCTQPLTSDRHGAAAVSGRYRLE